MKGQKILHSIGKKLRITTPTILTIVGSGGVVATTILAVKATPKALRTIEKNSIDFAADDKKQLSKTDTIRLCWKHYIPTMAVGSATIGLIVGANMLNKKQQANMTSIYALVDQSFRRYRKAADEVFGDGSDEKIKAQVAKNVFVSGGDIFHVSSIYNPEQDDTSDRILFYDYYSQRYFESTFASVTNAQYHLNRNWVLQGEVSINEFYELLGINKIQGGDDMGWSYEYAEEGYTWIDFDMFKTLTDDELECFIISPMNEPIPLWWDLEEAHKAYQDIK